MKIQLTEEDYETALGEAVVKRDIRGRQPVLGGKEEEHRGAVINAMPKVLARKIQQMLPENFIILEIELKIEIDGKPFGIGVGGEATVKFGPKV